MKIKRAEWPWDTGGVGEPNEEWKDAYIDTVSLIIWFGSRELNYTGLICENRLKLIAKWKEGKVKKTFIKITCIHSFIIYNGISLW